MKRNARQPRKLDPSRGSVLHLRMQAEDWARLADLRASLSTEVEEPSDAALIRFALKEAHAKHALPRVQKEEK